MGRVAGMTEPAEHTASRSTRKRVTNYGTGREALLDAAVRVVARGGLRRLTYRAVAQEAGVTHGLVVHHFGSRDALIEEALAHAVRQSLSSSARRQNLKLLGFEDAPKRVTNAFLVVDYEQSGHSFFLRYPAVRSAAGGLTGRTMVNRAPPSGRFSRPNWQSHSA